MYRIGDEVEIIDPTTHNIVTPSIVTITGIDGDDGYRIRGIARAGNRGYWIEGAEISQTVRAHRLREYSPEKRTCEFKGDEYVSYWG